MGEITITIKTDSNVVVGEKENECFLNTVDVPTVKKKGKSKHSTGHYIIDEELLYKVADAGLLSKMRGVKCQNNHKVYFFDYDEGIKEIITEFYKGDEDEKVIGQNVQLASDEVIENE